ncbi:hypothetical protein FHJ30_05740 [Arthrobacter sp. BB-1]|uniref:hypothetical protein n=1 Tax=unclassified Arthrobacter TaxID=235627 RepID=UPI001111F23A|nr:MULTISPECIES: hypothetical protein [unclassified Arthrobacter]TNB74197.1 hypothetical protein FHJ30_05740 [Arthrobacter sp. BB-1]
MIQSAAFVMHAAGHAVDFVVEPFPPADPAAALQAAMRGERQETPLMVPLISTGVESGPIHLSVEVMESRPEAISPGWEDIHEVSLMLPAGRAYFNTPAGRGMKELGAIMADERGSYRARLHAIGRDTAFDLVVEAPVEQHMIQFWKESSSPPSVISSALERGKSLPRFIKMWQGTPMATAQAEPRLVSTEHPLK